jgi:hypothetical protein
MSFGARWPFFWRTSRREVLLVVQFKPLTLVATDVAALGWTSNGHQC